jgi:hypothetical protein
VKEHPGLEQRQRVSVFDACGQLSPVFLGDETEGVGLRHGGGPFVRGRDGLGQFADGLVEEQLLDGHFQTDLTRPRAGLNAADGVAAQLEEVVVAPDALDAERQRPDRGECFFHRSLRRGETVVRAAALGRGLLQGPPVNLTVRGQWQSVERDEGRRDHVLGQLRLQVRA